MHCPSKIVKLIKEKSMQPLEIKKDIYWIGAVDYNHRDFHGYSLSPIGTTYTAYMINDEKKVLVDTVASHSSGTLFCRLAKICKPEEIDYIICNHMELDHAGALAEAVERCKPEKIFVSAMGMKSLEGYYPAKNWPLHALKTGDTINIGKRNLHFVETRMLHWPDSMVTYVAEDKLLFSNDAFGQNIASTERFGDEMSKEAIMQAVKEYYYNIVLPFSPQVLKAIEALGSLDIDMIAPDHGLMHRGKEGVEFIVNAYKEMALQKPQKRALIVYDTMWHTTERMASAIASGLECVGVPVRIMSLKDNHHSAVMTELANCGAVLVGSPTHNNTVLPFVAGMLTYMKGLRPKNRIAAAFGSYGWSGESPKIIHDWLESMGLDMVAPPTKHQWAPTHESLKEWTALGRTVGEALIEKCKA